MDSYIFYYEFESAEDGGKIYGGFLQASTYTEAMKILEDYTGSDLGSIKELTAYDNSILCVPVTTAKRMRTLYETEGM